MRCWPVRSSWPAEPSAPASATAWPAPNSSPESHANPKHSPASTHRSFITVSLVEATFFINVAFMALFVFATPGL